MTVSTISALVAGSSRAVSTQNTKASLSLGASVPATEGRVSSDQTVITYPSELQKRGASLRIVAQSIAHAQSQLDVASVGANEISSLVSQLDGIANRASLAGLTDSQRIILNGEFQALRQQINNVSTGSDFNGKPVLNGTATIQAGTQSLTVGGLTDADLFGGAEVNLLTADNAQQAVAAVSNAQAYVTTQQAILASASADVEYTGATVESAVQNQEASRSSLTDEEIASGTSPSAQSKVQSYAADALIAQTNNLPADILRLLAE